jgi:vacuolar-type H+-ATPase subunit C/Vma6
MLVVRGRFTYGLPAERLAEFHVSGSAISRKRFCQMLGADTLRDAAKECVGLVLQDLPAEYTMRGQSPQDPQPAELEALAWNRYLRLASRGFRRSHMGLGAVVAYAAIRRIELANLITLSEGIRTEMAPDVIRSRLVPTSTEAVRV